MIGDPLKSPALDLSVSSAFSLKEATKIIINNVGPDLVNDTALESQTESIHNIVPLAVIY